MVTENIKLAHDCHPQHFHTEEKKVKLNKEKEERKRSREDI